jgi:hypothetical protein
MEIPLNPKTIRGRQEELEGAFFNRDIHIRVTPKEQQEIRENAELSGLSMSEYIRRRALSRRVPSRIETKMLSELRRQGGLLKYIFNESHGMYSEQTATALDSLNSFIQGLEREVLNDSETPLETPRQ